MSRPSRIAMLAHSTNPRGGVVHALHLSESLAALGHEVVLHAPDAKGTGFFRPPACGALPFAVEPAPPGMTAMVEQRIADYVRHFEEPAARCFDLYHAHDGISGNALATLKERGLIRGFARTVHHVDRFDDPRLMALQDRSIQRADLVFTVSALWQAILQETHGITAVTVGNGVDTQRYSPAGDDDDAALRRRLELGPGPVCLSIGGVEERKNTVLVLKAFQQLRAVRPDARLVIAGGASLLDHRGYQAEFRAAMAALGADAPSVHVIGTVDDADMPALYRLADMLVLASVKEGFGLVVLEAMASGLPVVVSSIAPFTDYLAADDALWCDPRNPASIAQAMAVSLMAPVRERLARRGLDVAARHAWPRMAAAHLVPYERLREPAHA